MDTVTRLSAPKTKTDGTSPVRRKSAEKPNLTQKKMTRGFIYILTNTGIPGVVNIGSTGRHPDDRARELSSGNVPTPFEVCYYAWSEDAAHDATHLQEYLFEYRNRDTNFFTMSPAQAVQAVESQLHVKRMYIDETVEQSLGNKSGKSRVAQRASHNAAATKAIESRHKSDLQPPRVADTSTAAVEAHTPAPVSEKERIIAQAKLLETEQPDPTQQEQQKIEEAVAFELHKERNRQRALRLHEEHQRQQLEQLEKERNREKKREQDQLAVLESERKRRAAERKELEQLERQQELERRQQAQEKRQDLERKIVKRRQTAAAIKIVGLFFIVAALLGWFWGTQNSAGPDSVPSILKNFAAPGTN